MSIHDLIKNFRPLCPQEEADRNVMLSVLENRPDCLLRSDVIGHFTVSAWIVNPARTRTVFVFHKIYQSWSWVGGHADGNADFIAVALKEASEETGLSHIRPVSPLPLSLETITVDGHEKNGTYVPSHLHYNVTFLLEADESENLHVRPEENTAVKWFSFEEALNASTEPWMVYRIYSKLIDRSR